MNSGDVIAAGGLPEGHPTPDESGDDPHADHGVQHLQDRAGIHGCWRYSASAMPSTGIATSEILPRIFLSISAAISGLVLRKSLEASRPCPRRVSPKLNQAPVFDTTSIATPTSSKPPSFETPSPYITSNSATRNGAATLFLTTFT